MFEVFDRPHPDPNPLPMVDSPKPLLLLLGAYMIFVFMLGPDIMKNRDPYKLRGVLCVYNLGQVAFNIILFCVSFHFILIDGGVNIHCIESFPIGHRLKNVERYAHYAYFVNKIIDLLDTVFFVLRKSKKQITFLHVYHHILMVCGCYAVMRFYGTGGHLISIGLVNTFVHAVMYFYYFLSSFYPGIKGSLWWKKYITIIQLVQFALLFIYGFYVMLFSEGCQFPHIMIWLQITQATQMMYMFGKFYYNAYIRQKKAKTDDDGDELEDDDEAKEKSN